MHFNIDTFLLNESLDVLLPASFAATSSLFFQENEHENEVQKSTRRSDQNF